MTAEVKITGLTAGTPKATDVEPAVDTTDATQAPSGTTKKYVRADVNNYLLSLMGFTVLTSVKTASISAYTVTYSNGALGIGATLTNAGAQAAFTQDGVVAALNDRVLIKNQAAPAQNGVYTVTTLGTNSTNWVLTRSVDFNQTANILNKDVVQVVLGTTNNNTAWNSIVTVPVTVGTDSISFSAFSVAASLIPTPVSLANGGTAAALVAANGAVPYSTASAMAFLAAGSSGQLFQSQGAGAPHWTTPTYPSASGAAGLFMQADGTNNVYSAYKLPTTVPATLHIMFSNGTDMVSSTPAYPNASAASGAIIISDGTNYIASTSIWPNTVGSTGKVVMSNGTSNVYSTPTFPNASATLGKIIISDGTNWIASTPVYPVAAGTLGNVLTSDGTNWLSSVPASTSLLTTKGDLFSFSTLDARFPVAVGDGKILQVSSSASTGLAYSTPTYPSASGTSGKFIVSDGTNNVYSTSTIPTSSGATANKVVLSDGTNYVLSTPTFPNASATSTKIITSDGTNWIASTSLWVNSVGSAGTIIRSDGTTNTYTTTTYPATNAINTIMYASSANVLGVITPVNSAILVSSGGGVPSMSTTLPAFTTSTITFNPTTSGLLGTTTNDNASVGYVGEYISSTVLQGSAVSLTTSTDATITSISLTAGDWDVGGNVWFLPAGGTVTTAIAAAISIVAATRPTPPGSGASSLSQGFSTTGAISQGLATGMTRISLSTTTTVYLVGLATFITSTLGGYGFIGARRMR